MFSLQAALKHADAQAVIERLEQDIARLKLKHSLEIKVRVETLLYPARSGLRHSYILPGLDKGQS